MSKEVRAGKALTEFCPRSGIEAYLGTYWRVSAAAAASFATDVYTALASSATLDDAVKQARTKLHNSNNNEWANYILYGNGAFRLRPAQQ